ncbi:hypothetical protein K4F52_001090 [Lecanicillium sp. MT-2017a]|nr:hypothetical protein K4F52_001090 [Lecanicillium sp. MT-2017a]
MANYDPYDRDRDRDYPRHYVREERREPGRPGFLDVREYAKPHYSRDLVPRARQDSDLSVEEIRREFPPPTGRDIRRARSTEPYWEEEHYRRAEGYGNRYGRDRDRDRDRRDRYRDWDRDYDTRSRRGGGSVYDDDDRRKSKSMTKQEKIIAAVAGAALLVGGKELYDRHEAKEGRTDVNRNPLSSAALAGFGALAGYQGAEFYSKQQAKKDQKTNAILHRGRDGQIEYYSDEDDDKKSNKNFLESALAATGLGAAVKTLTGKDDKHSDDRSRRGSPTGSRRGGSRGSSHDRGGGGGNKIQKAAMASLLAGATEAFRVAREPGGWRGEKAKRIVTAAAGAATVDAAHGSEHGKLGLAESVIGGLVGNRLINGSKRDIEEDMETGRSRSRSRARSENGRGGGGGKGLAALATAGLGAIGAKKVFDKSRSRSRSRSMSRSRGRAGSYDSRDGSPDRRRLRSRSRSVVDKARNSLAKLGIGSGAVGAVDDHRRRDQDDFDDYGSRRPRRHDDYDDYDDDRYVRSERSDRSHRGGGGGGGRERSLSRRRGGSRSRSGYGSDTDLGDSSDDEKAARKMRGKQVLTTGLAAVATIHAAHNVYQSMDKRNARQRAVREGRLTAPEAKKLKTKAIMQDAASVGIAALGIKGALEELKEAKEMQHECKTFQHEKARRHERRLERQQRRRGMGPRQRSGSWSAPSSRPRLADEWDQGPRYYDDGIYDMRPALPPPAPAPAPDRLEQPFP